MGQMRVIRLLALPNFDDGEMIGPGDITERFEANESSVLANIGRELLQQLGRIRREVRIDVDIRDHVDLRLGCLLLRENHAQDSKS
jgi:hypothetical protein